MYHQYLQSTFEIFYALHSLNIDDIDGTGICRRPRHCATAWRRGVREPFPFTRLARHPQLVAVTDRSFDLLRVISAVQMSRPGVKPVTTMARAAIVLMLRRVRRKNNKPTNESAPMTL